MTLTDEEIRVKVAEMMGWKALANQGEIGGFVPQSPEGQSLYYDVRRTKELALLGVCPDYLNDPAAALQLCDRMHSEGWNSQIVGGVKENWAVTFHRGSIGPFFTAPGPSLARAVTLAFLKCHELQS